MPAAGCNGFDIFVVLKFAPAVGSHRIASWRSGRNKLPELRRVDGVGSRRQRNAFVQSLILCGGGEPVLPFNHVPALVVAAAHLRESANGGLRQKAERCSLVRTACARVGIAVLLQVGFRFTVLYFPVASALYKVERTSGAGGGGGKACPVEEELVARRADELVPVGDVGGYYPPEAAGIHVGRRAHTGVHARILHKSAAHHRGGNFYRLNVVPGSIQVNRQVGDNACAIQRHFSRRFQAAAVHYNRVAVFGYGVWPEGNVQLSAKLVANGIACAVYGKFDAPLERVGNNGVDG